MPVLEPSPEEQSIVVFFIHGVGESSAVWTDQMRCLNEKGYEIVGVDMLGHGGSSKPRMSEVNIITFT